MPTANTLLIEDILKFKISVYGTVKIQDFLTEIHAFEPKMASLQNIKIAIEILFKEGFPVEFNHGFLYSGYIIDPISFYERIEMRDDLSQAAYPYAVIEVFKTIGFGIWSDAYISLISFLEVITMDAVKASILAQTLHFSRQVDLPLQSVISLAVDKIGRRLTTDEMSTLMDKLMKSHNTLPNWLIKGHIPNDLHKKKSTTTNTNPDKSYDALAKMFRRMERNMKKDSFNRKMTLEESLTRCPKEQIKELASIYKIKGRSKMNREELAEDLEAAISHTIGAYTYGMTEHHLALLNNKDHDLSTDFSRDCQEDFLNRGWMFTLTDGYEMIYHIPPDLKTQLKKSFKANNEQITKNTELFKAYTYAIRLFGVMPLEDFIKWASVGLGRILTKEQFHSVAMNTSAINYDPQSKLIYDTAIKQDFEETYQTIQGLCQESYPSFDQEDIKNANYLEDDFLLPRDFETLKWLDNERGIEISIDFLKDVFRSLNYAMILQLSPDEINNWIIKEFLSTQKPKDAEIICFDLIDAFVHHAPAWINKGRTLEHLMHKTITRTEHKVGRNDPCPCGSGKKHKKCCGR